MSMGKFEFKKSSILFLVLCPLVLGYLLEQATPVAAQRPPPPPPPPGPFTYFRLALSWPPVVCTLSPATDCPRDFTIHGLWPDNHSGGLLRSCTTQRFVTITDPCLLLQLNGKWPDIRRRNNNPGFWGSQWSAHGTCATGYTQTEYFTLAVDLKDRYANLLEHLNRNEIRPRNTPYPVQCIRDAIQKLTTKIPDLVCDRNNRLQEIRICFNSKMADSSHPVINCPQHHSSTTCTGNIVFLEPVIRQTNTNIYFLEEE